jgi:hypothetical protein
MRLSADDPDFIWWTSGNGPFIACDEPAVMLCDVLEITRSIEGVDLLVEIDPGGFVSATYVPAPPAVPMLGSLARGALVAGLIFLGVFRGRGRLRWSHR